MMLNESHDHLFLHCGSARSLWHNLFRVAGKVCVSPASIASFLLMNFRGFSEGCRKIYLVAVWGFRYLVV